MKKVLTEIFVKVSDKVLLHPVLYSIVFLYRPAGFFFNAPKFQTNIIINYNYYVLTMITSNYSKRYFV